ncbi:GAF domain-containing protein [Ktedonosporobacter rubrisoli]|nr:GAF domain-containing protein [Ktedonosporobacter rubrisoli]
MQEAHPQNWRELLRDVIRDSAERQRIADALSINPITLLRWANGASNPRPANLRQLLSALPEHRELLMDLLSQEMREDILDEGSEHAEEVPLSFYQHVLNMYVTVPARLQFLMISRAILEQVFRQLDLHRQGGDIAVIACCMAPSGPAEPVRSLRECVSVEHSPTWQEHEEPLGYLGLESLEGYAVSTGRALVIYTSEELQTMFPSYADQKRQLACSAAHPICRQEKVAGCLTISSCQPHYFTPQRLKLIKAYAELLALAFEAANFYPFERISLGTMPPPDVQQTYLRSFRMRVTEAFQQAQRSQHLRPDIQQTEEQIWKQLEQELLEAGSHDK